MDEMNREEMVTVENTYNTEESYDDINYGGGSPLGYLVAAGIGTAIGFGLNKAVKFGKKKVADHKAKKAAKQDVVYNEDIDEEECEEAEVVSEPKTVKKEEKPKK